MTRRPRKATTLRLVVANIDKERAGDRAYIEYLVGIVTRSGGPGALLLQEVGHGLGSTQIRNVGAELQRRGRWIIGTIGVHRGVARGRVRLYDARGRKRWVRLDSVHGLHVRTSGKAAQDAYYQRLARRLAHATNPRSVIGGDFNLPITAAAKELGGTPHGDGIVGALVGPGLKVIGEGTDRTGIRRGWTDHPAVWINIEIKE